MSEHVMRFSNKEDLKFLDVIQRMIEGENKKSLMAFKSSEELALEIKNGQAALLFVRDEITGYCSYKIWGTCIEIMSLVVKSEQRGFGYGFLLFQFVVETADQRFPEKRILSLLNKNSVGIARRAGFAEFYKLAMPAELKDSCVGCLEEKFFPNCHCQTLSLPRNGELRMEMLKPEQEDDIIGLAEFYCEVWKEPPWNESYWRLEKVTDKIRDDLRTDSSLWLLAKIRGEIIGFALGHEISPEKFMEMAQSADFVSSAGQRIFYHAELAVRKEFRLRGIGSELMRILEAFAISIGCQMATVRTKSAGAMQILKNLNFKQTAIGHPGDPERKYWIKRHDA